LPAQIRSGLATVVREHRKSSGLPPDVTTEVIAVALIRVLPVYCIRRPAMLVPTVEDGVANTVRALWRVPRAP
jgi:hypothetical protein